MQNFRFLTAHVKFHQICSLIDFLKYKFYRGVISHDPEEELSFMTLKGDAKLEEKLTCGLENDMSNMAHFHQSTWKSQNWDFDGIL